ncbi:DivIVA domain-containing protein [Amycolatopsis sp. PS_44_ISF1]|uniref:DivIVA domain-containing protein n=1 Tax=Amycolatopsis sp. PS_44_ISF1 TaxID=2974917 RepID=UPI0028DE8ADB|nr:DivIVA domain-containing protein [Amycolatopsis sp. PS_44_ISF1]MDT8915200.1 DivIVA domain-containing protein [Amycolatopsis sp. PS_44_ISF1]
MENVVSESETAPDSDVRFPVVLRGYDRRQVDEYVRVAEKRLDRHEKARRMAERKLAKVPAPRAGEADPANGLGKRIEKILEVAKSEAEEIKRLAREEAAKILAAAEKTAADVDTAGQETERAAGKEAARLVSEAQEEAGIIRTTHHAALTELGQIAAILSEVRKRYVEEPEAETETEPEAKPDAEAKADAATESEVDAADKSEVDAEVKAQAPKPRPLLAGSARPR